MNIKEVENLIKELLTKTNLPFSEDNFSADEHGESYWYSVNMGHLSEKVKVDEVIQSLNHLVRRIMDTKNKEDKNTPSVFIDINGINKKKISNIRTIAHMMAERARYFKSKVEVDPMSAFDRRVVHEYLADKPDIRTESSGEGDGRRVVIYYVDPVI